jgi:aryl-alcohol dehydrogenase-like predicted oxidoreductase
MEYRNLGKTGLKVSRICLGCMSYGDPAKGAHTWVLNEQEGRPFIKQALDLGINFFDTANMYSLGASEEILGKVLRDFTNREDVVIASKCYFPMRSEPNAKGLSRKAIFREIDASLKRLGTDYIDLYQIHRFDHTTPIEETMEALHDIVKAGKVRYLGASSMYAWQFCKMQACAELHGWTKFVCMQPHYNLLYREEEREMLPLCKEEGIGVIPWSPLARGRLARAPNEVTNRIKTDIYGSKLFAHAQQMDEKVIQTVVELAKKRGVPQGQIALSWVLHNPAVTAPIIGATKSHHLVEAIKALSVELNAEEMKQLEANYIPHPVMPFE